MRPRETGRKNLVPKNRETGGIAKQGGAKHKGPTVPRCTILKADATLMEWALKNFVSMPANFMICCN